MARKQWEYLQVKIVKGLDGSLGVIGRTTELSSKLHTHDVLDCIGKRGWELVSVENNQYTFKREMDRQLDN